MEDKEEALDRKIAAIRLKNKETMRKYKVSTCLSHAVSVVLQGVGW